LPKNVNDVEVFPSFVVVPSAAVAFAAAAELGSEALAGDPYQPVAFVAAVAFVAVVVLAAELPSLCFWHFGFDFLGPIFLNTAFAKETPIPFR
jgi:hypothetical protein